MVLVVLVLVVSKEFLVVLADLVVGVGLVRLLVHFQVVRADLLFVPILANSVLHNLPIGSSPAVLLPLLVANQVP